jgi:hypothetical protein
VIAAGEHSDSSISLVGPTIALAALFFTVFSFWWIQARRGRLRSYPPKSYAGCYAKNQVILSFPFVLYNTGPAPIVVRDFRVRIALRPERAADTRPPADSEVDEHAVLPTVIYWSALQPELEPAVKGGGREMPAAFPVEGRKAVQKFVEFQWPQPKTTLDRGPYQVAVEVQLAHRGFWRRVRRKGDWYDLVQFPLHSELVAGSDARNGFLAHSNDPGWYG